MATHDATALVLGGAGSVGAETVRQLARRGRFQRLLVADLEAAQRLAQALGAEAVEIDVTNRPALVSLMRQAEAQVDYADVSDDVEPIQELFHTGAIDREARAAGATVVVGLGTSPGLTNIIARYGAQHLDTVTSVHFALCTGTWTRGAAVWAHRLHVNSGFATVYRDGRWTEVPAMSGEEIVTFPWPPGRASVHIVAHPEPLTLTRHLPGVREVVTKLGYPDAINRLLRDLSQYGLTSEESVALGDIQVAPRVFLAAYLASPQADRRFGLSALTPYSARQVTLTGTRDGREVTLRYQLAMSGGPPETVLPLVIAGEMLAAGQIAASGLLALEALDPLPFLQALASLGVKARLIREEASSGVISQEGVAGA